MPKISICIPTYNRSRMVAELLDSIIAQGCEDDIEVVVSDDASPDDTVAIVRNYAGRIKAFTFLPQPKNLGLDANFLAVVAAATGDYIWLMGDDDRIEPGGLARVLDAIDRWPGVSGLTLGVIDYDVSMTRRTGIRKMPETRSIAGVGALFAQAGELLGFMSALVIDRAKWNAITTEPASAQFKNYYIQVYIIGRVMQRFGKWGIVSSPCVGFRSGNDQFKAKFGWLDRLKIDVNAYEQIADALLADDPAHKKAFRIRIFNTHVMARINNAKTSAAKMAGVLNAVRYLGGHYGDLAVFWTRGLPTLLAPRWTIKAARSTYRRMSLNSGTARAKMLFTKA